jgi:hypothetical protein
MLRTRVLTAVGMAAMLVVSVPASAQIVQGFQIGAGVFLPQGYDARPTSDVLVTDLNTYDFNISQFNSGQIFGEYNLDIGKHLEFAVGVGYNRSTVPAVVDFVDQNGNDCCVDQNGNNIVTDLRLRVIPVNFIVRFMPFGKPGRVQPYVGAGVSALIWRYSEYGEFVDQNENIYQATYVGNGTTPAGLVLGGVRFPARGDVFALTVEARYQFGATGNLNTNNFLSNAIDLNGSSFNVGFQIRY